MKRSTNTIAHTNPYPPGTQVVTLQDIQCIDSVTYRETRIMPSGSVAVIREHLPERHGFAANWVSGGECFLLENEVESRRLAPAVRIQDASTPVVLTDAFVEQHVLFSCVVGSHAFGLNGPDSDMDIRGVYQLSADDYRSLIDPPNMLGRGESTDSTSKDEEYWELKHFLQMALKANPNILEALYSPIKQYYNEVGRELVHERSRLLSRHVYTTYNGYVASQYRKLEQDLRTKGEVKKKHAMHLIRLLLSGIHLVRHGEPLIDVGEYRETLLAIKDGTIAWDEVQTMRLKLHQEFEDAFVVTSLPHNPDFAWANDFLVRSRRSLG